MHPFWQFQPIFINLLLFPQSFIAKAPLYYILESTKTEIRHIQSFKEVRNITSVNFEFIIIDFEKGLKNALKKRVS